MSENLNHLQQRLSGIRALKHELALRFGLVGQVRMVEPDKLELMVSLTRINRELETHYQEVRHMPAHSDEEETRLAVIRKLEDERFHLLDRMNGRQIQDYGAMPLSPKDV